MKKTSEKIRETIGHLMYEQQVYQTQGNDYQHDIVEGKIKTLRSKLMTVEIDEKNLDNEDDD
jgi:hypothetical protein